jgi:hypothetical protein
MDGKGGRREDGAESRLILARRRDVSCRGFRDSETVSCEVNMNILLENGTVFNTILRTFF